MAEAKKAGTVVHHGRIFDFCVEKNPELPEDHPDRKFKGRAVFQGNNVHDQNWDVAMFQELSSCPARLEAAKVADAYGLAPGNTAEQSDATQAYTQSELGGPKT